MRGKIIKAGYLTIIAAVMVTFVTAFGDSAPAFMGGHFKIPPNSQNIEITIWNTRNVRVIMDVFPATSRISVYLLDEEGIKLFHDEERLQPVFSLEDVDGCDFTYQPPYRGVYAFIIQNNSNQTAKISQRWIHQGLEWDILQFSGILAAIGLAMSLLPRLPIPKNHSLAIRAEARGLLVHHHTHRTF